MSIAAILAQVQPSAPVSVTPTVNALVSSVAAIAVFFWVWRDQRAAWLGWLIATWVLWAARYVVALVPTLGFPIGAGALGNAIGTPLYLARDAAFTMVLFHLGARWSVLVWLVLLSPLPFAYFGAPAGQPVADWAGPYELVQHGVLWTFGAIVVGSSPRLGGRMGLVAAAGLLVHALVLAGSPWAGDWPLWRSLGIDFSSVMHLLVALGVSVGVQMRLLADKEDAEFRVSRALEYVVRGVVPMCAHCRSVRKPDGGWTTLEDFVEQRTEVPVLETRCPDCAGRASLSGERGQTFMMP